MKTLLIVLLMCFVLISGCKNANFHDHFHAVSKPVKQDQPLEQDQPVKQDQPLEHEKLSLAQLRYKYPQYFKINGSQTERKIALTFDDGPDQLYTKQILDVLHHYHVHATFFLVGFRAEANPAVVKRMIREGHAIGNHSFNHPNPDKLTENQFAEQIVKTQHILLTIAGFAPKLIRTPYGAMNENELLWAAHHDFILVNWDIDSLDWKQIKAGAVLENVVQYAHNGAIILQHSAGGAREDLSGTVKALPSIITDLRAEGYQFVTVPELLHVKQAK